MISIILSGEGHRDRGSPGGCDNQNDNGRWNGCCDKIRFCCLSAEGAGKPTSPYSTLISSVPGRPAQDSARRCRVLGTKWKSCARRSYAGLKSRSAAVSCRIVRHPSVASIIFYEHLTA